RLRPAVSLPVRGRGGGPGRRGRLLRRRRGGRGAHHDRPAGARQLSSRAAAVSHPTPPRRPLVFMQNPEYYSSVTSPRPRRRTLLRAAPLALATAALTPALASCTRASERLDAESDAVPVVDLSGIAEVPEIAALVPAELRARGELVNGAALNYAPGEFVGSTGE